MRGLFPGDSFVSPIIKMKNKGRAAKADGSGSTSRPALVWVSSNIAWRKKDGVKGSNKALEKKPTTIERTIKKEWFKSIGLRDVSTL